MNKMLKRVVLYFMVALMATMPTAVAVMADDVIEKEEISSEKMAADLLLTRPVGLVSMITGSILFVFSLPFSMSENTWKQNREEIGENIDKFMVEPAKYTFKRRLGDM